MKVCLVNMWVKKNYRMKTLIYSFTLFLLFSCKHLHEEKSIKTEIDIQEEMAEKQYLKFEKFLETDTIIADDTSKIKHLYTSKSISTSKIDYNVLSFNTNNALFNKLLTQKLNDLITKYLINAKYEVSFGDGFIWSINITPIFLNSTVASFEIHESNYLGGMHGEGWTSFKNYILVNNQLKELQAKDFLINNKILDSCYYDPMNKKIIKVDPNIAITQGIPPLLSICDFIKYDTTQLLNQTFTFHSKGLKLKYDFDAYDIYTPGMAANYHYQDRLIPYKAIYPILSPELKKIVWVNTKD